MNFFSYESKPMQILMYIADLVILNVLFVLCSIPIFTIGASHAALYSAIRTLQDPEDDTSVTKAFFAAFRVGFKQITLAWFVLFLITALMAFVTYMCFGFQAVMGSAPSWMAVIGLCLAAVFMSLVTLFHSRFSCTAWQLVRNCWFLGVAHPLRTLLVTALTWLPVILIFVFDVLTLIGTTPIWLLLYYSTAALISFAVMKKPFKTLIDNFNETNNPKKEGEDAEASENAEEAETEDEAEAIDEVEANEEAEETDVPAPAQDNN